MLKICGSKNAGIALEQFDLRNQPWPYADSFFDHAVSCGVLHFFDDLDTIFPQVARVVRTDGIFAFTTKAPPFANGNGGEEKTENVTVFTHSREYVEACVAKHGFKMLKHVPFFVENDSANYAEHFFAFVIQK